MVGGGLALSLDQNWHVESILSIPSLEWLKNLETVRRRRDGDGNVAAVSWWSLVCVLAWVVSVAWKTVTAWLLQLEVLAVLVLKSVGKRVEGQISGKSHGNDDIGRGDEGVGGRVGIVTSSEVTVVRADDRVGVSLLDIASVPLTNAWSTGVCEDETSERLKSLELSVTLDGGTNLLGTRSDSEKCLGLDTVVKRVLGDGCRTAHVLVRGVGARSNQTNLQLLWPLVLLDSLRELADRCGEIGSEGSVDMWLKLVKVDLDQLVVLGALVLAKLSSVSASEVTDVSTLGGGEVIVPRSGERKVSIGLRTTRKL